MDKLLSNVKIEVPEGLFIKNPESSELGKKIVEHSIILIDEIGFENFNFKKLGKLISSNESSIYRYFESKHKLLIYLSSWYWRWLEYQLVIETFSIRNLEEKLVKAIEVVTRKTKEDKNFSHINEVLLNQIIINENSKSYLTKSVDSENKEGYFSPYKRVVRRLAEIITEYNSNYEYPLSLASSITEGALHQQYMKQHFTSITNCNEEVTPTKFYTHLILNALSNEK
ncbi:TetR/AcrR family transcriptional regulator [Tenacibaculum sp. M341]|uniref:TetR/AcrR family transcriptional regulator n=1 Tax=Tenacibaculum sp. M341 TaxID=2530339 RepID=UPI0010489C1C|nr:TetR/AcrR family transcriptional regulator [Tenacibaculum sp. M341]TCI91065.1 TetR/AcrR family transcriptional regulator [Tenacibaculum sp. M341]